MKITAFLVAVVLALFSGSYALAKPTTFRNGGLKNEIVVELDVVGSDARGTFNSHPYDEDGVKVPFTGNVIPTPKGKSGVYLEIKFASAPPYDVPPDAKTLIWRLKIVNHRAHLFIPMQQRSYEGKTPKWIVADVELEPT